MKLGSVLRHLEPTVERAKKHETCDVCGRRGTVKDEVFSVLGTKWVKVHRRCLAWAMLATDRLLATDRSSSPSPLTSKSKARAR